MQRAFSLALFWFVYQGALGIFFPYYSLYLRENAGLSGAEMGWVLAAVPLVGMVAQPFWGQIADRSGARSRVLTVLAFGASFGYTALAGASGFLAILIATGILAAFTSALLPMTVSVSLAVVRAAGPYAFGLVRVWGTLGFLLLVVSFPPILHRFQVAQGLTREAGGPSEPGLGLMFIATGALAFLAALISLALPREGVVALRASRGDWRSLLKNKALVRFLLFSLAAYFLLQGPMWLFPVYVRAHGGDLDTIRRMWILMLVAEIPLVISSGAGLKRVGARGLLSLGVLAGGLRWAVSGLIDNLYAIYAVQTLHGVMVAGIILGGPLYLDDVVPERLRSTAQGLLSMVGVGIGGIASNAVAGFLLEYGGADAPYVLAGLGSLVLGCLVRWILPAPAKFDSGARGSEPLQEKP